MCPTFQETNDPTTGEDLRQNSVASETAAMKDRGRLQSLFVGLRKSALFRQLLPLETRFGWPLPIHRQGDLYMLLPCYRYSSGDVYPPFATLVLHVKSLTIVDYRHTAFRKIADTLPHGGVVGKFPHPAVESMTVREFARERDNLLRLFDQLFERLLKGTTPGDQWKRQFRALFSQLCEPSLKPYYAAMAPNFCREFLADSSCIPAE